jgi:hypothetical protein
MPAGSTSKTMSGNCSSWPKSTSLNARRAHISSLRATTKMSHYASPQSLPARIMILPGGTGSLRIFPLKLTVKKLTKVTRLRIITTKLTIKQAWKGNEVDYLLSTEHNRLKTIRKEPNGIFVEAKSGFPTDKDCYQFVHYISIGLQS